MLTCKNSSPEHARLERQARLFSAMMAHRVIHAPLHTKSVERVLDVGCGTGFVTKTLAEQFPKAQAYGIDLSPVPQIRQYPGNVTFFQGNIVTQPPTAWTPAGEKSGLEAKEGLFDLCYNRLVLVHQVDPVAFTKKEFQLLKPNGYIECCDIAGPILTENDQPYSDQDWRVRLVGALTAAGRFSHAGEQAGETAAEWLRSSGFVDIRVQEYRLPLGVNAMAADVKRDLQDFDERIIEEDLFDVYVRYCKSLQRDGVFSEEDSAETLRRAKECLFSDVKKYRRVVVTTGRKPEWIAKWGH